jgi:hypothetical protein
VPTGINSKVLSRRIDEFLGSRGYRSETGGTPAPAPASAAAVAVAPVETPAEQAPLEFVCEEDVRLAIQDGRTLLVSERAIVTPSARDLAERHRVLRIAPWCN